MFTPRYTITNKILKRIGIIDASREVILNSSLIPAWEMKFRKEALERTVHHGTHLEGNRLSLEEARDILDGREVMAKERDIQEVLNYRNAIRFIDDIVAKIGPGRPYALTVETIFEIHRLSVDKIVHPEKTGKFRTRQVVVKNSQTGQVAYTPPPAVEAPYLVEDLINWVNSEDSKEVHPVLKAGIVHYELSRIYPFVEGNGRMARATALLVMFLEGYGIRRLFSPEEYFDSDPMSYYLTLQRVSNQQVLDTHERDLTPWLEYFVEGMALETQGVKERVRRISVDSRVKDKLGEQVELNERQMLIMEYLHRHKSMQNKDFRKVFPEYSDDTVLREIRFLTQRGLIQKLGGTKKATYVLR